MSVPVGVGRQVNKIEQFSSDHHQMSLTGGRVFWGVVYLRVSQGVQYPRGRGRITQTA